METKEENEEESGKRRSDERDHRSIELFIPRKTEDREIKRERERVRRTSRDVELRQRKELCDYRK